MQTLVFNKETKTVVLYAGPHRDSGNIVITINNIDGVIINGDYAYSRTMGDHKLVVPLNRTNIVYT